MDCLQKSVFVNGERALPQIAFRFIVAIECELIVVSFRLLAF